MLQINIFNKNITKVKFGTIIACAALFTSTGLVSAEQIIVTGNGTGSTNSVSDTNTQTANITQTNTDNTTNNVNVDANTGGNNTSSNTNGSENIETGNTTTDIEIDNSGNLNSSDAYCCGSENGTAVISGNGSDSENIININALSTSTLNSTNTTSIVNKITGVANTGNNSANNNTNGNILIKTGDIFVTERIKNGPLNFNNATSVINNNYSNNYDIKISGNGSYSKNAINLNLNSENDVKVDNALDILNESIWLLNTGHNYANNNTGGNINILTGDIEFLSNIVNGPINVNNVDIKCCGDTKEIEEPTGGVTPVTPPPAANIDSKSSESKSSDGGKGGDVLATAIGSVLPVTGNYIFLFFMFGNVAMFLLGMVLRLRSGRSPGLVTVAL